MLETETIIPITQSLYYKQNNIRRQSKNNRSIQKIQSNREIYITPCKHSLEKRIINYQTTVETYSSKSPAKNNQSFKNKSNMLQPKGKPNISIQNLLSYRKERNSNQFEKFQNKQDSRNTQTKNSSKAQLQDSIFHLKKVENPTKQMSRILNDFKMEKEPKYKQINPQTIIFSNLERSSPSFSNILQDFKNSKIDQLKNSKVEEFKESKILSPKFNKDLFKRKLVCFEQQQIQKQQQQYRNNLSLGKNNLSKQQDYKSELADIYNGKFKIFKINR